MEVRKNVKTLAVRGGAVWCGGKRGERCRVEGMRATQACPVIGVPIWRAPIRAMEEP